jgi:AcrR family transcriptional regulator
VLRAARDLLGGATRFSIDAVARRAGVARMTVYHQFGSRRGLLEALFDSFAVDGGLPERIAAAFSRPDPEDTLADIVAAFGRFWQAGRAGLRRVRALGVLDPDLGEAIEARNERRRAVVRAVVNRLAERLPSTGDRARAEALLYTLTSFETFDTLAGPRRKLDDVVAAIVELARAAVGLNPRP